MCMNTMRMPPAYQCVFLHENYPGKNVALMHADPRSLQRFFGRFAAGEHFSSLSCNLVLMKSSLSGQTAGTIGQSD